VKLGAAIKVAINNRALAHRHAPRTEVGSEAGLIESLGKSLIMA
jgi:hypothetical protein